MTRLKAHHMAEGGTPQASIAAKCGISQRSVERILTEPLPTAEEAVSGVRVTAKANGRPSKADPGTIERIRALLTDRGDLPSVEVLRLAKGWGYRGGRSAMAELVKTLRPVPVKEPMVLFRGLPGEYVQFDFGECVVEFKDGHKERVQFFGGRLKYSRFMHVELVPNQNAETVVRSILVCLVVFGGSPKEWVFDNPKTMRISPIGVKPVILHPYLRQLVSEYNVLAEFCAPASGNQKGTVERLVGFVKNSFLRVRKFTDMADLRAQLAEWLHEVNYVRPCDATGEIPAVTMEQEERCWLNKRPIQLTPERWALTMTATITPMATVRVMNTSYSATDRHLGAPANVRLRRDYVDIEIGNERCTHVRMDNADEVQRLPDHREAVLARLHGERRIATFRRECLLELGEPAFRFMGGLVHRVHSGGWAGPFNELYEMLDLYGADCLRKAFNTCVTNQTFSVPAVRVALAAA